MLAGEVVKETNEVGDARLVDDISIPDILNGVVGGVINGIVGSIPGISGGIPGISGGIPGISGSIPGISGCWEKRVIFPLKQNPNRATRQIILNK